MTTKSLSISLSALLLLATFNAHAAAGAATVVMLTGKATALGADGTVRKLVKNDAVFSGDIVNSGLGSYVNLKFSDGAFFLLRPETRFQIEQYEYTPAVAAAPVAAVPVAKPALAAVAPAAAKPAPLITAPQTQTSSSNSRAFFRLVKGGFRSVSGLIGKLNRDDYRVSTPVATIGIRGTHYSARLCDSDCEDRAQILAQLGKTGQSMAATEPVLITTVDEGGIELASSDTQVMQAACRENTAASLGNPSEGGCGAILTSVGSGSVVIPTRPAIEIKERNLDPANCN